MICNLARVKANYDPIAKHAYSQAYYAANKDRINEQCRRYHAMHRAERSIQRKMRRVTNSDAVHAREREYTKRRLQANPYLRLEMRIRARALAAIRRNYQSGIAVRELGCSIKEFKSYIATKFSSGMTWKNYGKVWEFDHIKPLSKFDLTKRRQLQAAVHFTNIQPLLIEDHKIKTFMEK
jgi:hypothetical protein